MIKKTIVPCSGGIDSVGLLWKMLHETDDEIFVQHIRHKGFHDYWQSEEDAYLKILDYMKDNCRGFKMLPTMEFELQGFTHTRTIPSLGGAISAYLNDADRIIIAAIASDILGGNMPDGMSRSKTIASNTISNYIVNNSSIVREQPITSFDKRKWFHTLPADLIEMTVTCKHPTLDGGKWIPCNKCSSCYRYNEAKNGTDPIPPDQIKYDIPRYVIDTELAQLGKKSVTMFVPSLDCNNMLYLWNMLINTTKIILIQPIEVIEYLEPEEDREKLRKIIDFLSYATRKIYVLPTSKFTTNVQIDYRLHELIKMFCAGHAAQIYKNQIEEVIASFPTKPELKDQCHTIFDATAMSSLSLKEVAVNTIRASLPKKIRKILSS